jgi:hypothetical protein
MNAIYEQVAMQAIFAQGIDLTKLSDEEKQILIAEFVKRLFNT